MTNQTTKSTTGGRSFNRNSRYDKDAPTSVEMTKLAIGMDALKDPAAFVVAVSLSSRFNGQSQTGVINPKTNRIMHNHGLSEGEFADVLVALLQSGLWDLPLNLDDSSDINWQQMSAPVIKDMLLSHGVSNIGEFKPLFVEQARNEKQSLRRWKASFNHLKYLARYAGMKAGLAQALTLVAASDIEPVFNDLGYQKYSDQSIEPIHQLDTPSGKRKICHSVMFDHPMMEASTPEQWASLAEVKELTADMVASPRSSKQLALSMLASKFGLGEDAYSQVSQAVQEIRSAGFFSVKVHADPFGDGSDAMLTFTPTKKLHDAIWEADFRAGGFTQTQWEVANGHIPFETRGEGDDPFTCLPKLGYHYLYALKSRRTGNYLTVGQSTMNLETRLAQHKQYGTNRIVDAAIRAINDDPADTLLIECLGMVHNSVVARLEMEALASMRAAGHQLLNQIETVEENQRTIKRDVRLSQQDRWEQEAYLDLIRERHGEVIYLKPLPALV